MLDQRRACHDPSDDDEGDRPRALRPPRRPRAPRGAGARARCRPGARPCPCLVREPRRVVRGDRAGLRTTGKRPAPPHVHGRGRRPRRDGRSDRRRRRRARARRRGVRRRGGSLGRVRVRAPGAGRAEAAEPVLRGGGGRPHRGGHGTSGAARQGAGRAGAEGLDQRRLRGRRHLRRTAREVVRRRGDRRLQHGQSRRSRSRSAQTGWSTTRERTSRACPTGST